MKFKKLKSSLTVITILFSITLTYSQDWINYSSFKTITSISAYDNNLLVSTNGGAVSIDLDKDKKTYYNRANAKFHWNYIRHSYADKDKNLWFINLFSGLVKYNGSKWTTYNTTNSGIPDNNVYDIKDDLDGNYWLIYKDGLCKFDGNNWIVYNSSNSLLPENKIVSVEVDKLGTIWVSTRSSGVVSIKGSKWTIYNTSNSGLPGNTIMSMAEDNSGNMWFSLMNQGIVKFDGTNWTLFNSSNSGLPNNNVGDIEISGNEKWVICNYEVAMFDDINWEVYSYHSGLPNSRQYQIEITSNGDIWVLGEKELYRFQKTKWKEYSVTNNPLHGNKIFDIDYGADNKIWLSEYGDYKFAGQTVSFKEKKWNTIKTPTRWIEHQDNNTLWVGLYDGVGRVRDNKTTIFDASNSDLPEEYVRDAAVDNHGNMWFITEYNVCMFDGINWHVYNDSNTNLPAFGRNQSIEVDDSNNIWVGSHHSGLAKYNGTKWEIFDIYNSDIPGSHVNCISFDTIGHLWVGFQNYGAAKFNGTSWTVYDTINSDLASNDVYSINVDDSNRIWFGTHEGLAVLDNTNWTIFNIWNSNIPGNIIEDIAFDQFNNTWIATTQNGIGIYNSNGVILGTPEVFEGTRFKKVTIYPNPVSSKFMIHFEGGFSPSRIEIFDIYGKSIFSTLLHNASKEIDLSNFADGIYLYKVYSQTELLATGRILKQ